jgi:hypothetical protein
VVDVEEGDHKRLLRPIGSADLAVQLRKTGAASIHASQTIDYGALTVPGRCLAIRRGLQTLRCAFSTVEPERSCDLALISHALGPRIAVLRSPHSVSRGFATRDHRAIEGIAWNLVAHRGLELLAGLVSLVAGSISLIGGSVPLVTGAVSNICCLIAQRASLVAPLPGPIAHVADTIALVCCPITLVTLAVPAITRHIAPVTR